MSTNLPITAPTVSQHAVEQKAPIAYNYQGFLSGFSYTPLYVSG